MARKKKDRDPNVVNWSELPEESYLSGEHWGHRSRRLTPSMSSREGHIGVERVVVPPGRVSVPFHWHLHEDEVFIVLEGAGLLRYGDRVTDLKAGDCVSCPRGSGEGHQIANVSDADLVYLAIGENRSDEVAVYPDTGKVLVRGLHRIFFPKDAEYMEGEPDPPRLLVQSPGAPAPRKPRKKK